MPETVGGGADSPFKHDGMFTARAKNFSKGLAANVLKQAL
jgi:hypothetical protein